MRSSSCHSLPAPTGRAATAMVVDTMDRYIQHCRNWASTMSNSQHFTRRPCKCEEPIRGYPAHTRRSLCSMVHATHDRSSPRRHGCHHDNRAPTAMAVGTQDRYNQPCRSSPAPPGSTGSGHAQKRSRRSRAVRTGQVKARTPEPPRLCPAPLVRGTQRMVWPQS